MIKIETTENLIKINGIRFGKNTLNYWANGHNLFIGSGLNSGFIINNVKFDKITFNGVTPSTITELLNLFDTNFFKSASQGGGETSLTFSNGLTEEDGEVKLGGQLTDQFTIIGRNNPLDGSAFNGIWLAPGQNYFAAANLEDSNENFKIVTAYNSGFLALQNNTDSSRINFTPNELNIIVEDINTGEYTTLNINKGSLLVGSSNNVPINYQGDYSDNFTDTSLVNKSYVDKMSGWAAYQDNQYTSSSPFSISSNTKVIIPNNAGITIDDQKPSDISTFYDSTTQKILGRAGDGLNVTLDVIVVPGAGATFCEISIDLGGTIGEIFPRIFTFPKGVGQPRNCSASITAYTLDTWETNGGLLKIISDGDIEIYGMRYIFTRTHKAL